jgi:hypothetical protein
LQDLSNFSQIAIFWFENIRSGNTCPASILGVEKLFPDLESECLDEKPDGATLQEAGEEDDDQGHRLEDGLGANGLCLARHGQVAAQLHRAVLEAVLHVEWIWSMFVHFGENFRKKIPGGVSIKS